MNVNTTAKTRTQETASVVVKKAPWDAVPIGGMTPFTTIDFPGLLSAVLFVQGCPWRCQYCHNSHLWSRSVSGKGISREGLQYFLKSRRGFLDGIVLSGGEPTSYEELGSMIAWIRSMGYKIGLHTGGMYPDRLKKLLPLCHWVAMDIKAPLHLYDGITRKPGSAKGIAESVDLIVKSSADYEFRTTMHPDLLRESDIRDIASFLRKYGAESFALQAFNAKGCREDHLQHNLPSRNLVSFSLREELKYTFPSFKIRQS